MKNIFFKYLAAVAISIATLGLTSCDKEPEPEPNTESTSFAILYNGNAVAAGSTLDFHPSADEIANDWAQVDLRLENKTSENIQAVLKVEMVEGPDAMNRIAICYGETCKNPLCPWTSDSFTLTPGVNQNLPIHYDYSPSMVTEKTTYRFTVAKASNLDDPQVIFITVNAQ